MMCILQSLSPELLAQSSIGQHTMNFLYSCLVHAFWHPILLWCFSYSEMSDNAMLIAYIEERITLVFSTIIRFKTLDFSASLVFHYIFPLKENFKHFIFSFHAVYPKSFKEFINKCYKVLLISQWWRLGRSPHIWVNII